MHHGPKLVGRGSKERCLPHLSCEDSSTFREWVLRFGLQAMEWEFDVKVGRDSPESCERGSEGWDYHRGLLCKRIDALCRSCSPWKVVEVKGRGTALALGQLLLYRDLLAEQFPEARGCELILVCRTVDPDLERVLPRYGVRVVLL